MDRLTHWCVRGLGGILRLLESLQRDGVVLSHQDLHDLDYARRVLSNLAARQTGGDIADTSGRPEYL